MKYLLILGLLLTGCSEDAPVQLSSTVTEENGTVIETYSDGSIIKTYSDGTKQELKPDGTIFETTEDGGEIERRTDGSIIWRDKNGVVTREKPSKDVQAQIQREEQRRADAQRQADAANHQRCLQTVEMAYRNCLLKCQTVRVSWREKCTTDCFNERASGGRFYCR